MSSRTPLTVVIPTLNEASQIGDCVRGLSWAGEVIVVDAGSQDGTGGAAAAAGARVLDGVAPGIAAQRNAGIAAAHNEWVFALDADERIGPDLAAELVQLQVDVLVDVVVRFPPHRNLLPDSARLALAPVDPLNQQPERAR